MQTGRRISGVLAVVLGLIASVVIVSGSAQAGPYTPSASISVNTSNPPVGGTLDVTGTNFGSRESVSLDLHSSVKHLKTVRTNRAGSFSTTVKLPPKFSCDHTITAKGKRSGRTASTAITIGVCGAAAISVSDSTPRRGGEVKLTGINFGSREKITVKLDSGRTLATDRTDSDGTFSENIDFPRSVTCEHDIVATGKTSGRAATVTITIGRC